MQLWQDGLIAALAAIGLASLMWAAVRTALTPLSPRRRGTVALIAASGGGVDLEQQVNALRRVREEQNIFGLALLVDCGLNEEGLKLARLLARRERWVALCEPGEIGRYLGEQG